MKRDVKLMSDRELLIATHEKLTSVETRLMHVEANQTLFVGWARKIALARGADDVVSEIDTYNAETQSNSDLPTNG